jgi:ketosteroid isomerase-like protein
MPTPKRRALPFFVLAACTVAACDRGSQVPDEPGRRAIADTIFATVDRAYDLSRRDGDVVARLMSLYPDSGRVVSAAGGRVTTSRDSLELQVRRFWEWVGANMQEPRWTWGRRHVDVLSPTAAVMTATYTIEHRTPAGAPHVIGGAWTALFQRRDGRWVIVQEHLSDLPIAPPGTGQRAPTAEAP